MNYFKTLILSAPGKGKTFSTRNMNPERTGFLNCEEKPLPFINKFKHYHEPKSALEAYNKLIEFAKNEEIDSIVFDSLSSYMDFVLLEARKTKKGYDIWNYYNEEIQKLLIVLKRIPKPVFIFGHYEILGIEGAQEKRCKSKGELLALVKLV